MKLNTKDMITCGMMVAMMEAAKLALAVIPNVEIVSLLTILFTLVMGKKIIYVLGAFVLIEGVLYGFGIWWVMYLYCWPFLALVTWLLRRQESVWVFATASGVFGLLFGALCSLPYFVAGGWSAGFAWWIAGIPYDLIHGVSNFVLCAVLLNPLRNVLQRMEV